MKRVLLLSLAGLLELCLPGALSGQTPSPPLLTNVNAVGTTFNLSFAPYPSAQAYSFLTTSNLSLPFLPNPNYLLVPYNVITNYVTNGLIITTNVTMQYQWQNSNAPAPHFARLQITPMSSNALLTAIVLNRLAYGPTPDELERVLTATNAIGPQAFIAEQLAPETVTETIDGAPAVANIAARFVEASTPIYTNGAATNASIADLRAWHVMRGVGARRQLLEILLQFLENHFVTEYSKTTMDGGYLGTFNLDFTTITRVGSQFEYLENERWRNALLNSACTFYDLLRISAESPAMIIYLDTVLSKGNGNNVANENYARELMELFTMGVNNGYDQNDVTVMSRCWTGWSVQKVDPSNAANPFAPILPGSVNTNVGVWALNYKSGDHYTNAKVIFPGKTVPARFGPPWAGRNYELDVPARTGNAGMQDGYDVITNLANLPFTEEFISVKLCNLLVHDGFAIGYDFTQPNQTPEAQLVQQCMLAWENGSPKGQMRAVLSTIFNSALFQGNGAAMQKVKTPLEYTISAIRALRASTNGTGNPATFSADTDGYSISGIMSGTGQNTVYPLYRMGTMALFDRVDPNGYPEDGPSWISAGTVAERIRWIQTFCMSVSDTNKNDSIGGGNKSVSDPVGLLKYKLPLQTPPGSVTNAANIVDYLLSIIYPGEGSGNLTLYRSATINFLNTGDDGVTVSPLNLLSQSGNPSPFENRIRGAVAMLLGFQRFQEQ
jgi:uncharacterized protein (DUF1800 family)